MIQVARLCRFDSDSSLKAFVDVSINGQVLVKGIRVVMGKKGLFTSMPREKSKDGKWYETVMLLNEEIKQELQEAVLEAFNTE
ncbi:MAG: SpoVG family protein [Candidatus Omnitrophica bacterium]|nr:SpoVG family protein [Candidatus Omnitrophota bacterium]